MNAVFYISAGIAVIATLLVITRLNAVHALLYLIVSLLAVAMTFYVLGAAFAAVLEVIVYAGAIMVLFVFVVMMLNIGPQAIEQESQWLNPRMWAGPSVLMAVLLTELIYMAVNSIPHPAAARIVASKAIGTALFGPYLLGVEMASLLSFGWPDRCLSPGPGPLTAQYLKGESQWLRSPWHTA